MEGSGLFSASLTSNTPQNHLTKETLTHNGVTVHDDQVPASGPGHGAIAGDGLRSNVRKPPRPGRPGLAPHWPR